MLLSPFVNCFRFLQHRLSKLWHFEPAIISLYLIFIFFWFGHIFWSSFQYTFLNLFPTTLSVIVAAHFICWQDTIKKSETSDHSKRLKASHPFPSLIGPTELHSHAHGQPGCADNFGALQMQCHSKAIGECSAAGERYTVRKLMMMKGRCLHCAKRNGIPLPSGKWKQSRTLAWLPRPSKTVGSFRRNYHWKGFV